MLYLDDCRTYCLSLKGASESLPFGPDTLVFKVMDKIFAILPLNAEKHAINLKCDPEYALELRERYESIQPGYHMNKKHWNTIYLDHQVPAPVIKSLIDHSYKLIVDALPASRRKELDAC